MEQQQTDEKFMRLALNEAEKALEEQEVPIGAVVVADGMQSWLDSSQENRENYDRLMREACFLSSSEAYPSN